MDTANFEVVDDGSVRDGRGRRITPKVLRERLARESYLSGLTLRGFAKSQGVNYHTLITWREVFCKEHPLEAEALRRGGSDVDALSSAPGLASSARSVKFLECEVSGASSAGDAVLSVTLSDGVVLRGSDAGALAVLAKALRC